MALASRHGATVKDISSHAFVAEYAKHLKRTGKVEIPKWVDMVKTGHYKELSPYDPDWYYIRCASMARQIYLHPGVGIGALKKRYGGSKRNGVAPRHHADGSGAVARSCLKSLEGIKVIEGSSNGKGRVITEEGQRDLDSIATQIAART